MMRKYKGIHPVDGLPVEIWEVEESAAKSAALDEPRTVSDGAADLALLTERTGLSAAEVTRRALRLAAESLETKGEGVKKR